MRLIQIYHQSFEIDVNKPENNQKRSIYKQFVVHENIRNCFYRDTEHSWYVPHCDQYPVGTILEGVGSERYQSDKFFLKQKKLDITKLSSISESSDSVQIWSGIQSDIIRFRRYLISSLSQFVPVADAQLLSTVLFGGSWRLDDSQRHLFAITGIQHIAAASGYHLSVIISFIGFVQRVAARRLFAVLQVGVGSAYFLIAGQSASLQRALSCLVIAIAVRTFFHRQILGLYTLGCAVCILLIFNTRLLSDIGFQLSVVATAGILVLMQAQKAVARAQARRLLSSDHGLISQMLSFFGLGIHDQLVPPSSRITSVKSVFRHTVSRLRAYIFGVVLVSLVAQVAVAPLLSFHFGELSMAGVVGTLAVSWLVAPLFMLGIGVIALGQLSTGAHGLVPSTSALQLFASYLLTLCAQAFTWLLHILMPMVEFALFQFSLSVPWVIISYVLMISAILVGWARVTRSLRWRALQV